MPEAHARAVLITGSSGEIGAHLAGHFLAKDWLVLGVDAVDPAADAPEGLVFTRCDLANPAEATGALDALAEAHGAWDVLINCVGRIANAPAVSMGPSGWTPHDLGLWQQVVASGLTAPFHAAVLSAAHMLRARKRGIVVNISSVCAKGNPGQSAYSAAKAGLNGMTLALAKELGPVGIRVVSLAPGYFDTRSMRTNVPEARLSKVTAAIPLRRLGAVSEIATAIDFIIANEYVTGTIVELDGGLVV